MGVYKEGKNWKVQVYYKDWQGNRKRKQKRGFRTKGEAKEWEKDFLQQQSQGVDIEFGNFLEISVHGISCSGSEINDPLRGFHMNSFHIKYNCFSREKIITDISGVVHRSRFDHCHFHTSSHRNYFWI